MVKELENNHDTSIKPQMDELKRLLNLILQKTQSIQFNETDLNYKKQGFLNSVITFCSIFDAIYKDFNNNLEQNSLLNKYKKMMECLLEIGEINSMKYSFLLLVEDVLTNIFSGSSPFSKIETKHYLKQEHKEILFSYIKEEDSLKKLFPTLQK